MLAASSFLTPLHHFLKSCIKLLTSSFESVTVVKEINMLGEAPIRTQATAVKVSRDTAMVEHD